jgi:transcriptional regulator with AAA-type ATPase domain
MQQEKGSYNLESLVDKDDLSSLKNVDPAKILEELNSKLKNTNLDNNVKTQKSVLVEDVSDDEEDSDEDDKNLLKLKEDAQKRRQELVQKLRQKTRAMSNNRKGKEHVLKNDISSIKENPMYKGMGTEDIGKMMQQMIGNTAQTAKQKKMMKNKIEKMMEKIVEK